MTGLTTEIKSVLEALEKMHSECVRTYGKPPERFFVGRAERFRLWEELVSLSQFNTSGVMGVDSFHDIPIQVIEGIGIDFKAPRTRCEFD